MKTIELNDATASLAEYVGRTISEPLIVVVNGEPVAALVPVRAVDLETLSLSTNPDFLEIIERSRARQKTEGSVSIEEARRRLGVADVPDDAMNPRFQAIIEESRRQLREEGGISEEEVRRRVAERRARQSGSSKG